MTGSSGRNIRVRPLPWVMAAALLAPGLPFAHAQPLPPATFYGTASIDGAPAPAGARVTAFVGEVDCTQDASGEVFLQGETAVYVASVLDVSQREGCGRAGALVTFAIDGRDAAQSATWELGPVELNLNTGAGAPAPIPPVFATAQAGGLTSGVSDEDGSGSEGGLPWGRVAVAGLALAGLAAAVAGAILRTRRRA